MSHWYPPSSADSVTAAKQLFVDSFGAAPAGVWSAPGRVNLIGEHVDYAGGVCLPFALPWRAFAAVRPRTDGVLRLVSGQLDEPWTGRLTDVRPGNPGGWAGYAAGMAWAMRGDGLLSEEFAGADVAVYSDVPLGAGLSSSAALECSLAVALAELFGPGSADPKVRTALMWAGVRAENEIVQASTGGMDQAAALHAVGGRCLRLDCLSWDVRTVPLPLAEHGLTLLVINTNAPHRLVDSEYRDRRAGIERATSLLGVSTLRGVRLEDALGELTGTLADYAKHVITETGRAISAAELLDADRPGELGPLLTASHVSLRDDFRVSSPELDVAVSGALSAGALGARMVGGGFGGSAIALVPADGADAVAGAVVEGAARAGLPEPALLHVEADGAARREQ